MLHSIVFTTLAFLSLAACQDSVSTQQNPFGSLNRTARIQLARAIFETMNSSYDSQFGLIPGEDFGAGGDAQWLSAMATQDRLTSTTLLHDLVMDHYTKVKDVLTPSPQRFFGIGGDYLAWGLATFSIYRAYQEPTVLEDAVSIWRLATRWVITDQDARIGFHQLLNLSFSSACADTLVTGGVLNCVNPHTFCFPWIFSATQGAYVALSAYLHEATDNQTYYEAAFLAHSFTQTYLCNGELGCFANNSGGYDLRGCARGPGGLESTDLAFYLEGLSVLASKSSDSKLAALADQIARTSMVTPLWVNRDNIITEEGSSEISADKGLLIRALFEHWSRRSKDSDIAIQIRKFIATQYNSLLQSARHSNTNWYSPNWTGPAVQSLQPWGQLSAIDVFNSAIDIAENTTSITTSTMTSTTTSNPTSTSHIVKPDNKHSLPKGAIIGIVIGGVCIFLGLIILIIIRRGLHRDVIRYPSDGSPDSAMAEVTRDFVRWVDPFPSTSTPRGPALPEKLLSLPRQRHTSGTQLQSQQQRHSLSQHIPSPPSTSPGPELQTPVLQNESRDEIPDLIHRINRALANLPLPSSNGSTAPPAYD